MFPASSTNSSSSSSCIWTVSQSVSGTTDTCSRASRVKESARTPCGSRRSELIGCDPVTK